MKSKIYISVLVTCFLTTGSLLACSIEEYHDDADYSIVFIGDIRSGYDIYTKLLRIVRMYEPQPKCAVILGDITSTPGNEVEWHNFWYINESILPDLKFYTVVGNHDVDDSISEEIYKKNVNMPNNELYYSITVEEIRLIILDSEMLDGYKQITGVQYTWLENELTTAQADGSIDYIFIVIHRPLYPQCAHKGDDLKNADQLQGLFETHNKVKIILSGHDHCYSKIEKNNIIHITTGGGGSESDDVPGGFFHLTKIGIYKATSTINIKIIGINGKIIENYNY